MTPNQPSTPSRTLRIPDAEWEAAKAAAAERGETVTAAVRRFLKSYVRATNKRASEE